MDEVTNLLSEKRLAKYKDISLRFFINRCKEPTSKNA